MSFAAGGTSILGALLWTGCLGGAVATHVRVGDPLLSHVLAPVYVATFLWGALWLRNPTLRALVPWTRRSGLDAA
jgi:DoxX-like protein